MKFLSLAVLLLLPTFNSTSDTESFWFCHQIGQLKNPKRSKNTLAVSNIFSDSVKGEYDARERQFAKKVQSDTGGAFVGQFSQCMDYASASRATKNRQHKIDMAVNKNYDILSIQFVYNK